MSSFQEKLAKTPPRARDCYEHIVTYIREHGIGPTIVEIAEKMELTAMGVLAHFKKLEQVGLIERKKGQQRSLRLVDRPDMQGAVPRSGVRCSLIGEIRAGLTFAAIPVGQELVNDLRTLGDSAVRLLDGELAVLLNCLIGDIVIFKSKGIQVKAGRMIVYKWRDSGRVCIDHVTAVAQAGGRNLIYFVLGEPISLEAISILGVVTAIHREINYEDRLTDRLSDPVPEPEPADERWDDTDANEFG